MNESTQTVANMSEEFLGETSDYILIAMITAMMMFMTLCCLCLFCRTTSRCTICGFDFEVSDESIQPTIEDLDELHEVVPLTPTSRNNYSLPDIERILQSDPPPPRYSEVTRASVFRWSRAKHKNSSTFDKDRRDSKDAGNKTQRARSLMTRRPRFSFRRSRSCQAHHEPADTGQNVKEDNCSIVEIKKTLSNENIKMKSNEISADAVVVVEATNIDSSKDHDDDDVFV